MGVVFFMFLSSVTGPAKEAGDSFMGALKDGDYARAYTMGTPSFQKDAQSAATLQRTVESAGAKPTEWSFNNTNIDGDTGTVAGSATYAGGRKGTATISVAKVDGAWKVDGYNWR